MSTRLTKPQPPWRGARARLRAFLRGRDGATAIEYALIAAAIAVTIIAAIFTVGDALGNLFNGIGDNITNAGN